MPLSAAAIAELAAALPAQSANIAEALNRCFDGGHSLEIGPAVPLADIAQADLETPGLVAQVTVAGATVLMLLPEGLLLPDWYAAPDAAQAARLTSLGFEWSVTWLPPGLTADSHGITSAPSLWDALQTAKPLVDSVALPAQAGSEKLWFVVASLKDPETTPVTPLLQSAEPPRIARLLSLPVVVSVQLARKRIELGTLRGLAPGSLVTFEKSCEDLLDLYVNNRLFCRGEAVKVGEKFGLKINEVGPVEQRVSAVIDRHARG